MTRLVRAFGKLRNLTMRNENLLVRSVSAGPVDGIGMSVSPAFDDNWCPDANVRATAAAGQDQVVALSIKNLTKNFTRGAVMRAAVCDLTIDFHIGEVTTLLGHNGAGKTTTL